MIPAAIAAVLTRASVGLDLAERRELAGEHAQRAQAIEEAETRRMMAGHQIHVEEVTFGYSGAELARHRQDAEAARAERVAELEAELDRLDPQRRVSARRSQSDIDAAALLQRARETGNSPFMRQQVAELERREQRRRDEIERARLDRLAEPPGGGWPVIRR